MNKLLSSLFFAALLASAGCQKAADLDRLQEETLTDVKVYVSELDILQKRAESLLARGRGVATAPGVNEAGKRLTEVRARLERLRGMTQSAPTAVAEAAKTGFEALKKSSDELVDHLDDGIALVRADLEAVESWIASSEHALQARLAPQAPQAPEAPQAPAAEPGAEAEAAAGEAPVDDAATPGAAATTGAGAATPAPTAPAPRAPATRVVAPN